LPDAVAKKLPRYPLLPATLLGRLAVSQGHRGRKLGRLLLADAMHRSYFQCTAKLVKNQHCIFAFSSPKIQGQGTKRSPPPS
jgi:predicted GNAT family N-acyltransferase